MNTDKIARDKQNNQSFGDIYIHSDAQPWLSFSPGIDFKVLRATAETGHWTTLFRCGPGSAFARHEHLGAGEYLMISGKMNIRGGAEVGGITAYPGDYGFEPNGVIHDQTEFPVETVLYFTNFGPIRFMDDDNNTLFVLDWKGLRAMEEQAKLKLAA